MYICINVYDISYIYIIIIIIHIYILISSYMYVYMVYILISSYMYVYMVYNMYKYRRGLADRGGLIYYIYIYILLYIEIIYIYNGITIYNPIDPFNGIGTATSTLDRALPAADPYSADLRSRNLRPVMHCALLALS